MEPRRLDRVTRNGQAAGDEDPWAMSDDNDGNDGDRDDGTGAGKEHTEETVRLPSTQTEINERPGPGAGANDDSRTSRDVFSTGAIGVGGAGEPDGGMSVLEVKVLGEYERLSGNMRKLTDTLTSITTSAATAVTTASTSTSADNTTNPSTLPSSIPSHQQRQPLPSSSIHQDQTAVILSIADNLRHLERQIASVYTLMKASVYSIVLQQGQDLDHDQ